MEFESIVKPKQSKQFKKYQKSQRQNIRIGVGERIGKTK